MTTLRVQNLFKLYQNAKYVSARNISFEVNEGEIFGFLGINGAGKSTTIKCLTGIIPFTAGKIEICGHDIKDDPYNAKRNFGFVPDNHATYDKLTGTEYVNYISNLYSIPIKPKLIATKYSAETKEVQKQKVREEVAALKKADQDRKKQKFEELVKIFKLENSINNQIMSYSHGMKQKISIIGALIHEPKLWILDEPMVGLDPQSIFEVKNYMKEYAAKGNSVIFSSHNLDTVEKLCDRALIIHGGRVIGLVDLHEYRKSGKDLEAEFMKLTAAAKKQQDAERQKLGAEEAELGKSHGKRKASQMIQRKVRDEVFEEIDKAQSNNVTKKGKK